MGTMVQQHKLDERAVRGERFRNHPVALAEQHRSAGRSPAPRSSPPFITRYLEAGADIIETNTFAATAIAQADFNLESFAYDLNVAGARLARAAADEWSRSHARSSAVRRRRHRPDQPHAVDLARRQQPGVSRRHVRARARRLPRAGPRADRRRRRPAAARDDLRHAQRQGGDRRACSTSSRRVASELPVMISATITDRSGRTLSGQTLDAFYVSIGHVAAVQRRDQLRVRRQPDAAVRRRAVAPRRRSTSRAIPTPACPTPLASTTRRRPETARLLREFAEAGVLNIVGGCCGTTPEHIRAIADAVTRSAAARPRAGPIAERFAEYSGLETLTIRPDSSFILIGERTNVTGSKRFAKHGRRRQVHRRRGDRAGAGPRRRQHPRRQHGRGHARLRGGDDDVPQRHRHRARDRPAAGHGGQLEVVGDRSRTGLRPREGDRQLDQPQGRRRRVPAQGADRPPLRRGGGGDGLRRTRARRTRPDARSRSASAPTGCSCARGSIRSTSSST